MMREVLIGSLGLSHVSGQGQGGNQNANNFHAVDQHLHQLLFFVIIIWKHVGRNA